MHFFHLDLHDWIHSTSTTCLQSLNFYFAKVKKKLKPVITPNTLESIIEYMLISSILNRICEMTKKTMEYLRDETRLVPLWHLLKIRAWGTKWKRAIDKTNEWVAWWWANAKINKESLALLKQTTNISKEDREDYNWAMFTHAMDFFKEWLSLKRMTEFHKRIEQFVDKEFGNTCQLAINKNHETSKTTLCNSR